VLVLGAGASKPFGYPVSDELRDWIVAATRPEKLGRLRSHIESRTPALRLDGEADSFIYFLMYRCGYEPRVFAELHDAMMLSNNSTIDRFLRNNEHFAEIGKAMISYGIQKTHVVQDTENRNFIDRTYNTISLAPRENWYKQLLDIMQAECHSGSDISRNKLEILTFNYDTSLEEYLRMSASNAMRFGTVDYNQIVRISHVYGQLEMPPSKRMHVENFFHHCVDTSKKIGIVGEGKHKASEYLRYRNIDKIALLGFGFDPENAKLVFEDSALNVREFLAHNFDGRIGVANRMRQSGLTEKSIVSGTRDSNMPISEFLADGWLV